MLPYTLTDAEAELRDAINTGDPTQIDLLAVTIDAMTAATQQVTTLAAALWYAEAGLHVFPIQPGEKTPYPGTHGCKDATSDPDTIREWWEHWPDSNLAIATGHLIDVIDIDGLIGQQSRCGNWGRFESLHVLAKVSTPRPGGMHLYVPTAGEGNKAGLLPGIDYRGAGGYILAPPSSTPKGTYRFLTPLTPSELARK